MPCQCLGSNFLQGAVYLPSLGDKAKQCKRVISFLSRPGNVLDVLRRKRGRRRRERRRKRKKKMKEKEEEAHEGLRNVMM